MIKYFFIKEVEKIKKISIKGHALYAPENHDIVCASVSTAIIITINAIEIFELQSNIDYSLKKGSFSLELLKFDSIINKLLLNLEYNLKDLSKNYPKYLKEMKD
ncbi:ribosomal-processing cysteine protease Prp [Candidatus Phytoplasma sp. AldY-WA1]|jgi:uncharacterized protein YsxB (DUF464 family)|uniref:ribosomal-processing cysteine protease Prp n=1 Tax=Candidatus Phytoplasma sp. AldY-WA1 TaxID=2852100 RepID=UPI001CE2774E|nr:ribosomal-processing cysteine protease Prp [Candidatus Phytoplasma sp. AldY-WA1]